MHLDHIITGELSAAQAEFVALMAERAAHFERGEADLWRHRAYHLIGTIRDLREEQAWREQRRQSPVSPWFAFAAQLCAR